METAVKPTVPTSVDELPLWMKKIVRRQSILNKKYEFAHGQFATAYNDFLSAIDEVNSEHDTEFTFEQAVEEYGGMFANDAPDEVEDDDDEDDED